MCFEGICQPTNFLILISKESTSLFGSMERLLYGNGQTKVTLIQNGMQKKKTPSKNSNNAGQLYQRAAGAQQRQQQRGY